ncbi:MAG: E3 ubiquitin ligase family protein [Thiohalocapsa sp.]|nr:E3 ubiquitin ligase family protein [Thiohalocapsa sp.]MCF7992773.1 E3 ubiquitin ligase family protein [Thiohalocapsa sp.]
MLEAFATEIAGADPVGFWIGTLIAAAVTAVSMHFGLRSFWKLRIVVDTPTARIRSAPQGYVELQGHARPQRELIGARLTGRPCVWFRYKVEERRRSGKNNHWVTIEKGDAGQPFILDDGTGRCLVEPDGATIKCRTKVTWYGAYRGGSVGHGPSGLAGLFRDSRRYRMTEERISDHEFVYLLGHFETPRRGGRERRELTRTLLSQWKRNPERMNAFDRNGDGEIDLQEWAEARAAAERIAEQAEAKVSAEPPLSRVGRTGDNSHPFVISTEDERTLVSRLRWSAFGGTLLGITAGIGAALALVARGMA